MSSLDRTCDELGVYHWGNLSPAIRDELNRFEGVPFKEAMRSGLNPDTTLRIIRLMREDGPK